MSFTVLLDGILEINDIPRGDAVCIRTPAWHEPGQRPWLPYLTTAILVAGATLIGRAAVHLINPTNLVMLYLVVVVIAGLRWGQGPAVLASVLGVLVFDWFLVPPYHTFAVADAEYMITFAALLVVALAVGTLTARLRDQAMALRRREQETASLYAFTRTMAAAQDLTAICQGAIQHVKETWGLSSAFLTCQGDQLRVVAASPDFTMAPLDWEAAQRSVEYKKPAEWGNVPWGGRSGTYLPMVAARGVVGVLAIRQPVLKARQPGRSSYNADILSAQLRMLEAFAVQAAMVVERAHLAEEAQKAHLLEESQRLHDALLQSISHALRTPLATIIGSLSTLTQADRALLGRTGEHELLETAREEADRLNRLVSNLLDMTRLESGHLRLRLDLYDPVDVIGAALEQAQPFLGGREVQSSLAEGLPLVELDQVLIIQVLENLLANAIKYSPPGSPLMISVRQQEHEVEVMVADRGPGIPAAQREQVFHKFHRLEMPDSPAGTGLGLAICKGIVEAHHGRIWASEHPGGGAAITFAIPKRHEVAI